MATTKRRVIRATNQPEVKPFKLPLGRPWKGSGWGDTKPRATFVRGGLASPK